MMHVYLKGKGKERKMKTIFCLETETSFIEELVEMYNSCPAMQVPECNVWTRPVECYFKVDGTTEKRKVAKYFLDHMFTNVNKRVERWNWKLAGAIEDDFLNPAVGLFISTWNEIIWEDGNSNHRLRVKKVDDEEYSYKVEIVKGRHVVEWIGLNYTGDFKTILNEFAWFGYGPEGKSLQSV
jgi:hypothetical protein